MSTPTTLPLDRLIAAYKRAATNLRQEIAEADEQHACRMSPLYTQIANLEQAITHAMKCRSDHLAAKHGYIARGSRSVSEASRGKTDVSHVRP